MNNRINDKIEEIEEYLSELSKIMPLSLEIYRKDIKTKAANERYIEKIAEAIVDLAYLIVKDKGLKSPENDAEAFEILASNSIIGKELAEKLQDLKGMKNIIAHQYGEIDDEIVFNALAEEIEKDVNEFIKAIKNSDST